MALAKEDRKCVAENLKIAEEEIKIHAEVTPTVAMPNVLRLDLLSPATAPTPGTGGRAGR